MNSPFKNPNVFQVDGNITEATRHPISIRCPHCRQLGSFAMPWANSGITYVKQAVDGSPQLLFASIRICPNRSCRGLVFVIEDNNQALEIEPPELLDFSPDNLPSTLLTTLNEAIACHGVGAYRAAAMMVRRLLEEICSLNDATGANLHQKLDVLKSRIVLPHALFEAMTELKALGNDAAHIEAKAYDDIGKDDASVCIELAKEILKALYQLQGLLGRLQARKTHASTEPHLQ